MVDDQPLFLRFVVKYFLLSKFHILLLLFVSTRVTRSIGSPSSYFPSSLQDLFALLASNSRQ